MWLESAVGKCGLCAASTDYSFQIPSTSQPDDVVLQVLATDRDSGDNGRVTYFLDEAAREMFTMAADGSLSLLAAPAADAEYLITVTAADNGSPRLTSSVPIRIAVTSERPKQQPRFPRSEYE